VVIQRVATAVGARASRDPQVRATGVKNHIKSLGRGSHRDGAIVLSILIVIDHNRVITTQKAKLRSEVTVLTVNGIQSLHLLKFNTQESIACAQQGKKSHNSD
jgi:hypothetical protein